MIQLEYDSGLFDNYIDMCYVLTMENSNRKEQYMNQLELYKPLSKVIIQINKGYKTCSKNLYKQASAQDLNHSYLNAFDHAKNNNYKNILIFEDDFFFDRITQENVNSIGDFINNNKYHVYNLGPIIHMSYPVSFEHHKSFYQATSHAVIYSSLYIDYYLNNYDNMKLSPVDQLWNSKKIKKYKYYKSICYQTFPVTENQANWGQELDKISRLRVTFLKYLIKKLNLDNTHYPGYIVFNIFGYTPLILLIIIVLYLLINIYMDTWFF